MRKKSSGPLPFSRIDRLQGGPRTSYQKVDTGVFPIQSWTNFKQQFWSQFFPVNMEADAINTLEGSSYYQGSQTVDDYLNSFLTLASDTRYTDP